MFDSLDKVKLTADLKIDFQSVVYWGNKWHINLKGLEKIQHISFFNKTTDIMIWNEVS